MIERAKRLPLAELRREIHMHPEMGYHEHRTSGIVADVLARAGLEVRTCCATGVVGVLRGAQPGPTVAIRADMDALPITEATGWEYASREPGRMHACGHDCHTAAALGAALLLADMREQLRGNVCFFFQPDEEGSGGAKPMIEAGCLEDPHVDAVFGMHVAPDLPAGAVGVRYGKFYAASNMFHVEVHGRSSHGAEPEKGINALTAAAKMLLALEQLREEQQEKHGRLIITTGRLQAGTAGNILPGEASFDGIIRTLGPEARRDTVERFSQVLRSVAEECGVTVEIRMRESYPGVVNHDPETALAESAAKRLLGGEHVVRLDRPTMTTEDFGYFLQERPGSFLSFGVGGDAPLHNPCFLPDESLLPVMAALEAEIALAWLAEHAE